MSLCTGQNIDQHSFKFANLSKEVQILGVNTDNKFSFESRTKISCQILCDFAGMAAQLDNDHKRISVTVGSRMVQENQRT